MNKKILYLLLFFVLCCYSCGYLTEKDITNKNGRERIIETGELKAVETSALIVQRYGKYWYEKKVIGLLRHGSIVQKGDSILQFDPSGLKKLIVEWESNLKNQKAEFEKLKINQETEVFSLESNLNSEKSAFELKRLELEATRFETEKIKKIKQMEFEQAKIRLEQAKRSIEAKKTIMKYDLELANLSLQSTKERIESVESILPKLTVRSPISGIFQLGKRWDGVQDIKIGDELYDGEKMGSIPNLKWMKVSTQISELDYLKIREGQKVSVRLDAIPELKFEGKVSFISKFCYKQNNNSQQKVFDVEVRLTESDKKLKPGMTVSCEFYQ